VLNTETFISRGQKLYSDHDYEKTDYKNCRQKVTITCLKHGDFTQLPYRYLQGVCFQKCGLEKQTKSHRTPRLGGSLLDKYPKLCKEWSDKNKSSPKEYKYSSRSKIIWKCLKCENEWTQSINVRTALKCGCPKCNTSKGESKIEEYLINQKIDYKKEYSIKECKDKRRLRFDFAIWVNKKLILIEYNGRQHYDIKSKYYIESSQKRDNIKIDFCKENNIKLVIISYKEYSNIENILSLIINEKI
jgi:hypothetical protein